jgi:HD-like signal output (HDOD) protein
MTVATFDMFVGKTDRGSLRRRGWWRHSIDSAICCRWLAEKNRSLNADEAYTGGLLHLLGKNLLDRFGGESYDEVMARVDRGYTDIRAEKEVYGITHIQVMQQAALSWHLPENLAGALNYAEPLESKDNDAKLRACVALGSRLAYLAKHGQDEITSQKIPAWTLEALNMSHRNHAGLIEDAGMAIVAAQMPF